MAKGSLGGINLNDTIRLPDPQNKRVGKHRAQLSFTGTELYRFGMSIGCNAKFCNYCIIAMARGVVRG